jgi:hypothetical protein
MPVVHNLVAHIDRRSKALDGALDDFNRAFDAGAEAARLSQNYPHANRSTLFNKKRQIP